jgi:diguanylate cyclase (GGDEF)-like protein
MKTVVVTHGIGRELAPLKGALAALGYDVLECGSAFETLQLLAAGHVEALISSVSLPDLSGYHLACLVKSTENAKMLPIIVVNAYGNTAGVKQPSLSATPLTNDFALLANRCRMVIEVGDSPQALKTLQTLLPRPEPLNKALSGTLSRARKQVLSNVQNLSSNVQKSLDNSVIKTPDTHFSPEELLQGVGNTFNDLLIEKIVSDRITPLLTNMESRSIFAEHFFNVCKQLIDCSICGVVLADTNKPWGALNIYGNRYKKEGLQQWLKSIGELSLEGLEIDFDVTGELQDKGSPLPSPVVFEVCAAGDILGLLVFAPARASKFDELSLKIIHCLQERMDPIMQLKLNRERMADKERFPIVTDELTGVYNLDFLIGFMQQQLLFSFRQRTPLSLVLLHIEGIKEVNSKIGWEAGDHLLTQIATWLSNHTRGSDIVARCGGSTFAMVLPSTSLEGARIAANNCVQELKDIKFASDVVPLKIQTGCAVARQAELNPEVLLRDAQDDLKLHVSNIPCDN